MTPHHFVPRSVPSPEPIRAKQGPRTYFRYLHALVWVLMTLLGPWSGITMPLRLLGGAVSLYATCSGKATHLAGAWIASIGAMARLFILASRSALPYAIGLLQAHDWTSMMAYTLAAALLLTSARHGGEVTGFLRAALADCKAHIDRLQQYGDHGRECRKSEQAQEESRLVRA